MKTVNPLHRSDDLHRDAGTFYRSFYPDSERIHTLFDSFSWANQLLLDDALDAAKLFVRTLIPSLHKERFLPIRVYEKVYREGKKNILLFGQENFRFGDNRYFGHPAATVTGGVELPEGVVDIETCCDLPVDPSVILIQNEHFLLRNNTLFFTHDLFEIMPVDEESGHDRSVILYLRGISVDRRYVQDRLGYLLRTEGPSTQSFVDFNNLVMDCILEGTNYHRLSQLIGQLYDVPCTGHTETVERLGVTESGRWLATDKKVYHAPHAANFLYQPGENLQTGTILTDAVHVIRGRSLPNGIPVVMERRFLGNSYQAGLIFPNEEVPLEIGREYSYPTFRIIGKQEDVRLFWDSFYSRTDDRSLLSQAASGGILNPARFIYDHVLYPRAQFYQVFLDKTGPNRLPNINTRVFRSLLPPGILFALLVVAPSRSLSLDPLNLTCTNSRHGRTGVPVKLTVSLQAHGLKIAIC